MRFDAFQNNATFEHKFRIRDTPWRKIKTIGYINYCDDFCSKNNAINPT